MQKALITGITGMVGSHLADFLLTETDWEVYGVCRWNVGEGVAYDVTCPFVFCRTRDSDAYRATCTDFVDCVVIQYRVWFHFNG